MWAIEFGIMLIHRLTTTGSIKSLASSEPTQTRFRGDQQYSSHRLTDHTRWILIRMQRYKMQCSRRGTFSGWRANGWLRKFRRSRRLPEDASTRLGLKELTLEATWEFLAARRGWLLSIWMLPAQARTTQLQALVLCSASMMRWFMSGPTWSYKFLESDCYNLIMSWI